MSSHVDSRCQPVTVLRWTHYEDYQAFLEAQPILAAANPGGGSLEDDLGAHFRRLVTEHAAPLNTGDLL